MTTATTNKEPIFLVTTANPVVLINVAAGTTVQSIFTAGADGGAITGAAAAQCDPSGDLRGSEEYKRDVTRVLTKRAVRRAVERARASEEKA